MNTEIFQAKPAATTQTICFQCRQGFGNINIKENALLNGSPCQSNVLQIRLKLETNAYQGWQVTSSRPILRVLNRSSQDPNDSGYEDATSNWYLKWTSTALQTIRKEMALSTEGRGLIAGKFTAKIVNRSVTEDDYKSVAAILKTLGNAFPTPRPLVIS